MEGLGTAVFASSIVILALLAVMGVVLAVVSARKTVRQKRFFEQLHTELEPGQRVMFAGGLFGALTKVRGDVVEVRLKGGTLVEVSRYAIQQIVEGGAGTGPT